MKGMCKNSIVVIRLVLLAVIFTGCSPVLKAQQALYLDKNQPIEKRVANLMQRMTLEEKVAQMCQYVGVEHMKEAEENLSVEEMANSDASGFYTNLHSSEVENMVEKGLIGSFLHVVTAEEANYLQKLALKSRLKIPLIIGIDAIHGNGLYSGATIYPTPISLASTFEPALAEISSQQTALEMRATGTHWTFTPNVDVARDARWGRVGETFGEDPYLVTQMGVASINGFQQKDFTGEGKVLACVKHLIAGSEPPNGLNLAPMDVSERTLREVFLPPYKAAVEAGVFSAMTAHNEVNGIPSHNNAWMMTDIMRNEFGFEGFYVSDWMDIERLHNLHAVASTQKEACFLTVDAGMDMHMHGPNFLKPVMELVEEKRLTEERINESVTKILTAKFKLGLFENSIVDLKKIDKIVFQKSHQEVALEAARKSIVLLKNENLLPLNTDKYKNILVTGPNADDQTVLGDWALVQPDENVITIKEGIQQVAPSSCNITFFDSGDDIRDMKDDKIDETARIAEQKDLVIVVVGSNAMRYHWNNRTTGENVARADINLAGKQLQLVKKIHATGTPVLIVFTGGRPLSTPWIDEHIPAILQAWEPGSFAGQAVAEIVFGKVNPSGKLPITIPRSVGQIQTIYNHKAAHYYRKYTFEKTGPLYPFGYGMSYTTFSYSKPRISEPSIEKNETTTVSAVITNTGKVAGEEIVQLYINDEYSSVTRPLKELKGFKRIALAPGESKEVVFDITPEMLSFYDVNMKFIVESGAFKIMVGSSSKNEDLQSTTLIVR